MANLENLIQTIVSRVSSEMAAEIARVVRTSIAAEITGAANHRSTNSASAKREPGRPKKSVAAESNGAPEPSTKLQPIRRPRKGGRRRTADVIADAKHILEHIKEHPGLKAVELLNQLKLPKSILSSALTRLRQDRAVVTKGQRSGMTYVVAS